MLALDALLTIVNEIEAHSQRVSSRTDSDIAGRLAVDIKATGERTVSTSSDRTGIPLNCIDRKGISRH